MLAGLLGTSNVTVPPDLLDKTKKLTALGSCERCCGQLCSIGTWNTLVCSQCRVICPMVDNNLPTGARIDTSAIQSKRTDGAQKANFTKSINELQGCPTFHVPIEVLRLVSKELIQTHNVREVSSIKSETVQAALLALGKHPKVAAYKHSCIAITEILKTGKRKVLSSASTGKMAQLFAESLHQKDTTYVAFVANLAPRCNLELPRAGPPKRKKAAERKKAPKKPKNRRNGAKLHAANLVDHSCRTVDGADVLGGRTVSPSQKA